MGLFSKIFGGSKQKSSSQNSSESYNRAYPDISSGYSAPGISTFNLGTNAINNELSGGFQGYRDKTGFDFLEKLGLNKVAGSYAGKGVFQSGAALKGLANYENGIEKASYNDYLDKLFKQSQTGLGAGQLVGSVGNYGTSTGSSVGTATSNPGIGAFLGQIIGGIAASDPRLKENIEKIGTLDSGLGVYTFDYINGDGPYLGVMADEVRDLQPQHLGPEVNGYMTVDYTNLKEEISEWLSTH